RVDLLGAGRFEDGLDRYHDTEIDDLVIVAGQHHAHDVLADIVDVALDRGHQDFSGAVMRAIGFGFHEGQEMGDGLFHDARGFDHLGQEHLARPEQVADDVHAGHQRTFDDVQRALGLESRLLGVGDDIFGYAIDQRVGDA